MYAWNSRIWKSKNGYRTIYEKMDCTNNISVIIICCKVGSIHETTETDGFAHLLEHILLTSDTNHISCTQTFQQFDKMGVEFNAHTTKTNTCFMIKCLTPFIKTVIDMLANIMFHSNIETRNAAVEQNVIYHENQTDDNDSINTAELKFKHNVYKDTPYAKPIDKKRANQPPVQSPLLQAFYKKYYVPNNIIISIISDLPYHDIQSHIEKSLFNTIISNKEFKKQKRQKIISIDSTISVMKEQHSNTCTIIAGFIIPNPNPIEEYTLHYLKYYLNRIDGILFQHIRMKQGVAYQFFSDFEHQEVGTCFSITVETSNIYIIPLLTFIMTVFKDLKDIQIHEDVMVQVKHHIKHLLQMKYRDIDSLAEYNMQQVIQHTLIPYDHLYHICYQSINSVHVQECARKYFTMPNVIVSIVTNEDMVESTIEHICKTTL